MAVYHKLRKRSEGIVKAKVEGKFVTYRLSSKAQTAISNAGVSDGQTVPGSLFSKLRSAGEIFTGQSTLRKISRQSNQLELPGQDPVKPPISK